MTRVDQYVCAFGGRRDYYQLPIALAEGDMLDRFVTDAYFRTIPRLTEKLIPSRAMEAMRFRNDSRIPDGKVKCLWSMIPERQLRRRLGYSEWQLFAVLDRKLSLAAADLARRGRSNLLLYNPYAWEAFNSRYSHSPRKVLFQFHPHPDSERRILLGDYAQHPLFEYSYEQEMGEDADELTKRRTRDCWRHADLIICASAFTKRSLVQAGADASRCKILPYGIDVQKADELLVAPERFNVTFVGSGTQRKGLHHLLLAWQKAALPKGSELTVVCRFIDAGLERLVHRTRGVKLVRGLNGDDLQCLYRESALFAMPSLVEGFGQVYLEALAQGCPVIGTANTCLPDIGPSPAVMLVEPGNIDQLVAKLESLSGTLPGNGKIRRQALACATRWPWAQFRSGIRMVLNSTSADS